MRICQNCGKKLNRNFTYCYECGCNLDEGSHGDFKTSHLNVFRNGEDYIYIFAVHGKQIYLNHPPFQNLKCLCI
ncbi:hypothetical protein [Methanobrevibacter sp.]